MSRPEKICDSRERSTKKKTSLGGRGDDDDFLLSFEMDEKSFDHYFSFFNRNDSSELGSLFW